MLKNIDPRLNAQILHALRAMGHGDFIVLCDTNFPAHSVARETVVGDVLRMEGASAAEAIGSILSVLPLDTFIDNAAQRMEVVGSPNDIPAVQMEVQQVLDTTQGKHWPLTPLERFTFYDKAKQAFAIIATGETRFYGCFILTKGAIAPEQE